MHSFSSDSPDILLLLIMRNNSEMRTLYVEMHKSLISFSLSFKVLLLRNFNHSKNQWHALFKIGGM